MNTDFDYQADINLGEWERSPGYFDECCKTVRRVHPQEYKHEYLGSWNVARCAVQDSSGQHCPDEPVHHFEHNGVTIGLCARCFINYQNGAFDKDRNKGIAREDRLYIKSI